MTETVAPNCWPSKRSTAGDLQTFPVQTVRIEKSTLDSGWVGMGLFPPSHGEVSHVRRIFLLLPLPHGERWLLRYRHPVANLAGVSPVWLR